MGRAFPISQAHQPHPPARRALEARSAAARRAEHEGVAVGQKIHPIGVPHRDLPRLGARAGTRGKKDFARLLKEDRHDPRLRPARSSTARASRKIEIERKADALRVIVHTAKPGVLIGRKGVKAEELKKQTRARSPAAASASTSSRSPSPSSTRTLVAEGVAEQLVKRAAYRRTLKRAITQTMERGAQGREDRDHRPPRRRRDRARREAVAGLDPALDAARRHRLRHGDGAHHVRQSSA